MALEAPSMVLTGHGGAGFERGGHFWVDRDVEAAFDLQLVVPLFDLLLDPAGEGVAQDGVPDVGDPLLRELLHLDRLGEVRPGLLVRVHELVQLLHRERLVLRDLEVLGIRRLDEFSLSGDQVLQLQQKKNASDDEKMPFTKYIVTVE